MSKVLRLISGLGKNRLLAIAIILVLTPTWFLAYAEDPLSVDAFTKISKLEEVGGNIDSLGARMNEALEMLGNASQVRDSAFRDRLTKQARETLVKVADEAGKAIPGSLLIQQVTRILLVAFGIALTISSFLIYRRLNKLYWGLWLKPRRRWMARYKEHG